jgi:hypothetical protein
VIYFLALLPATGLTIAGYFVLYLSSRTDGTLRTFGKYLGFWAFALAGLVVLGSIFAAAHGAHRGFMRGMHGQHCPWDGRPDRDRRPPGEEGRGPPPAPPASVPNAADAPNPSPPATH